MGGSRTGLHKPLNAVDRAKWAVLVGAWKKCVPFESGS